MRKQGLNAMIVTSRTAGDPRVKQELARTVRPVLITVWHPVGERIMPKGPEPVRQHG